MRSPSYNSMTSIWCQIWTPKSPVVKKDLQQNAQRVTGGRQTDLPKASVYSSVVILDGVRTTFPMAVLNILQEHLGECNRWRMLLNIRARISTKLNVLNCLNPQWTIKTTKFRRNMGWPLGATLRSGRFQKCLGDPDMWMRPVLNVKVSSSVKKYLCTSIIYLYSQSIHSNSWTCCVGNLHDRSMKNPTEYPSAAVYEKSVFFCWYWDRSYGLLFIVTRLFLQTTGKFRLLDTWNHFQEAQDQGH
jgi:hypothetical protein